MAIGAEEYAARRERLAAKLAERGIDALFLPPSADLEYLTGVERDLPSFGEIIYAHDWVTGAFFAPGREPLFVLPRMFVRSTSAASEPDGSSSSTRTTTALRSSTRRLHELGESARSPSAPARRPGRCSAPGAFRTPRSSTAARS